MIPFDLIIVPQGAESQAVVRGLRKCGLDAAIEIISIPIGTSKFLETSTPDTHEVRVSPVLLARGLSDKLSKAKQVLLMGLCGSLDPNYGVGDCIAITSCINQHQNQVDLNLELTSKIKEQLAIDAVVSLTSDRIITQAAAKHKLSQQYPVKVVEMEGYDYVTQLQQQGIAVAMLRVVSDDPTGDIPDLNQAVDLQGNLQTIPMAIALIKQPRAAIRLIRGSLIGLKALEQVTVKLFSHSNTD